MPENINLTLNVQVVGGPRTSASKTITVDAYDKIRMTIPAGEDKVVEVQPGDAGRVQFLLINSDQFGDEDHKLTYKVNAKSVRLDAVQLLIGEGAVGLLGAAPKSLTFDNQLTQAANIEIIVGRNAIGDPQPPPNDDNGNG